MLAREIRVANAQMNSIGHRELGSLRTRPPPGHSCHVFISTKDIPSRPDPLRPVHRGIGELKQHVVAVENARQTSRTQEVSQAEEDTRDEFRGWHLRLWSHTIYKTDTKRSAIALALCHASEVHFTHHARHTCVLRTLCVCQPRVCVFQPCTRGLTTAASPRQAPHDPPRAQTAGGHRREDEPQGSPSPAQERRGPALHPAAFERGLQVSFFFVSNLEPRNDYSDSQVRVSSFCPSS